MEIPLADETDVPEDGQKEVDFAGRPVVVVKKGGKYFAYINCCTHVGGPVKLQGDTLACQWHGAHFDAQRGTALNAPAPTGSKLISLPIQVKDGKIFYVYP